MLGGSTEFAGSIGRALVERYDNQEVEHHQTSRGTVGSGSPVLDSFRR
jgi:hypothetical protein